MGAELQTSHDVAAPDLAELQQLSFLDVFLYNAKPSFEIAKWIAKHIAWQNMKITAIIQQTKKLNAYITLIFAPTGARPRGGRTPFGEIIRQMQVARL